MPDKILLLIDANSLIYRSFFALPPFTAPDGRPTGALYGLANSLLKILKEIHPEYVLAAYDRPEPTFREQEFEDYKITRPATPSDLVSQLKESKAMMEQFNIMTYEMPGFEADDIIATLTQKYKSRDDLKIAILSGDHDTLQLVEDPKVNAWIPQKGANNFTVYDEKTVIEKYGVRPDQIPDYKALVGDKSDNIPGVSGIGPKTAVGIISEFGSIEDFYGLSPAPINSSYKKLIAGKQMAVLSKRLATVRRDVPLPEVDLSGLKFGIVSKKELMDYFTSLGFHSLASRLEMIE
ncbi:MAG TPA: 5'-3' exonuclease H3TH domain-containing protein [Candidatus Colwellbacteria bacterium]|nr:5'-3' exonuclease H3TH domain-containing protein [Candidatus Colwellbacteria bacterium]HQA95826.1 5'-3' exonuclease H3TH domain-containing protein [Candidatus Colwellbacteria bacterium]